MSDQSIISWQTTQAKTFHAFGYAVTLQAQALKVHTPFFSFVWNRPAALLVHQDGAQEIDLEERIPIVDATRLAQIAMIPFAALIALLIARMAAARKGKQ